VADGRTYTSSSGDRRRRNEMRSLEQVQVSAIDIVNRGSSELLLESIEPVAHAAGTVDSQDGSGLVM
jgi:hypothetical protein